MRSSFAQRLEHYSADEAASEIARWLDFAHTYTGMDPTKLDFACAHETLYEWLPRKITAEPEFFEQYPEALAAFFRFLDDRGELEHAERFGDLAEEAKDAPTGVGCRPGQLGDGQEFPDGRHGSRL